MEEQKVDATIALLKIVEAFAVEAGPFKRETLLFDELGMSSLSYVELLYAVEELYEISETLSIEEVMSFTTIGKLEDHLVGEIAAGRAHEPNPEHVEAVLADFGDLYEFDEF